jgi:hypothetical protein
MHRIIFTLISVILFILNLRGEDTIVAKLLSLEKIYYSTNNDSIKTTIALQKFNYLISYGLSNNQKKIELNRVEPTYLNTTRQRDFFWNASLVFLTAEEFSKSIYYYERYNEISKDTSEISLLLAALIYAKIQPDKANDAIANLSKKDSVFNCLNCLTEMIFEKKNYKKEKIICSAFIPGLGSMLNGNLLKGFTSTVLNTASITFVNYLVLNACYFNTLGWGVSLFLKFYVGNLHLTEKLIDIKSQNVISEKIKSCELSFSNVFSRYTIAYKK